MRKPVYILKDIKKGIRYLNADLHNCLMGGGVGWTLQIAKFVLLTKL